MSTLACSDTSVASCAATLFFFGATVLPDALLAALFLLVGASPSAPFPPLAAAATVEPMDRHTEVLNRVTSVDMCSCGIAAPKGVRWYATVKGAYG